MKTPNGNAIVCLILVAAMGGIQMQFPSTGILDIAAKAEGAKVSIWNGVYTSAQGKRGEEVHAASCASCHGARLNGAGQPDMPPSPAIAGTDFLRKWTGRTVAELFDYVRTQMPTDNPGSVSEQDSVDAVAHMFAVSDIPSGDKELSQNPTALAGIVIEGKSK